MSRLERQQRILQLLSERQSMTVKEISDTLFFSESSVRRDVREMAERGLVTHLWGGVMLTGRRSAVVPVSLRDSDHAQRKERIAKAAAARVRDGDTLLLDASSTARRIVGYLQDKKDLRIVTNNQRLFNETMPASFRLFCTGGSFRRENHNFCGPAAEAYLKQIHADLLFFSSQGLSDMGEINDVSEEETSLRRVMLTRAKKRIFLCDSSKLGISHQFVLCSVREVDEIICDEQEAIAALLERLRQPS